MAERHTTDANCVGYCKCPECGVTAFWSPAKQMHGCADPDCAHQFREHDDTQFQEQRDEDDDE